jgi:XTP/dITP diphosphohydrolase
MKLVLATRNAHKLREFGRMLPGHELIPLPEDVRLPPEDGETFAENAAGKAVAAYEATGIPAFADDSGIVAAALDGAPGIRSARYAGDDATDQENLDKLLRDVAEAAGDRSAHYVCSLVYVPGAGQEPILFEATCEGRLIEDPRGERGFGYDPSFVPDETPDERTMGELEDDEKDAISHRGKAARGFAEWLDNHGAG